MPIYTNGLGSEVRPQDDTYVDPGLPIRSMPQGDPSRYPDGDIFGPGSAYNPGTYTGRGEQESGLPNGPIRSGPVRIPGSPGYGETPADEPNTKKAKKKSARGSSTSSSSASGSSKSRTSKSATTTQPANTIPQGGASSQYGSSQSDDGGPSYTGLIIAAIVVGAGIALYAGSQRKKRRTARRSR